jgi:hypothetical protein
VTQTPWHPDMLRKEFAPPTPERKPVTRDPFAGDVLSSSSGGWADTALANELDALRATTEGGRNDALNTAAFNLGQIVAGGGLDYFAVAEALTEAARDIGLDSSEIAPTIRSGLKSGEQHPRTAPERKEPPTWLPASAAPWDSTPGEKPAPTGSPATAATTAEPGDGSASTSAEGSLTELVHANLPRIDWHALWADTSEEEWIIEPILPARRLVALYSPPKTGKSLLMLELAAAVAAGRPVLGVTPDRPRVVLYVDFENDPKGDIRQRLQRMGYGPDGLANLAYLSFPTMAYLDGAKGGEQLMAAVHVYGAEVVIIDTVSRSVEGEENDNDTWLGFYRHTGLKLKQAGVALIRLDHTGKDETKGQRGGSAKGGDVDAVWRLQTLVRDESYVLTCEMNRMPVLEKTVTLYRKESPLRHEVDAAGRSAIGRILEESRLNALQAAGCGVDIGREAGSAVIRAAGVTAPKSTRWPELMEAYARRLGAVPEGLK